MRKWFTLFIGSLFLGFLLLSGYLYIYLGAFKGVQVLLVEESSFHIIYKTHIGPYHEINHVIQTVEKWAQMQNFPCTHAFGEFLDDPEEVPHERLRSHGGCFIAGGESGGGGHSFQALLSSPSVSSSSSNLPPHSSNLPPILSALPEGFFHRQVPGGAYIEAQFSGSPSIGPFFVYPKIKDFVQKKRLKTQTNVFEIYEAQGHGKIRTRYLIPLQ